MYNDDTPKRQNSIKPRLFQMKNRHSYFIAGILIMGSTLCFSQTPREQYEAFRNSALQTFNDFRDQANQRYVAFIKQAWRNYQALPEIPKPQDEPPLPPIIYEKQEDEKEKLQEEIISLPHQEILPVIEEAPQPKPIAPIKRKETPAEDYFCYTFFGTNCKVRLGETNHFTLKTCNENELATAWQRLASEEYNNLIRDCLEWRSRLQLCDWAYLLMLQELSQSCLGKGTNESVLLTAYLFCQSGYEMRLAEAKGKLYLLFGSKHIIYDLPYWSIEGKDFYPLDCQETSLNICQASFPNEQPLSLQIAQEQLFAIQATPARTLQARDYPTIKVSLKSNQNLMDFMETYPSSMIEDNFCTRWALYANTPLSKNIQEQLYPTLKKAIQGKTQEEAANMLINFVQTAFVYEYDEKVWGGDRAFFADETCYYPYCDCEDRSILYTRLIRDLLGLKTALVYYPGHLATAVHFTEKIQGDYLLLNGESFLICDPTYIGAPIGMTMPDMDNKKAKVILLQ